MRDLDLLVSSYDYDLPNELIANFPSPVRGESRLLQFTAQGTFIDRQFKEIVDLIPDNSLLVINNTKVIPARVYGRKESGGKVEILLERMLEGKKCLCHVRANRNLKPGIILILGEDKGHQVKFEFIERQDNLFILRLIEEEDLLEVFEKIGHIPLPPYIQRQEKEVDKQRYQTVYSDELGAIAAPTAGLHFTEGILTKLQEKGIEIVRVTLHVGAGTFQPVTVDNIVEHKMHAEYVKLSASAARKIREAKLEKRKIIAVGTTAVRALETAALIAEREGKEIITEFVGDSKIFLYPGERIRLIDFLITNFHLPKSTLIMLVSALYGREKTLEAYNHAISKGYKFFSYGDACLVPNLQEGMIK